MTARVPGILVTMGGEDFVLPPLTLGQLRRLMPKIRALKEIGVNMGEDQIGTLAEIVAEALRRNYPAMTAEHVENELLDLGNAPEALTAILTGSGLRKSGEAEAGRLTGATSMASSPVPSDLPEQTSTN